MIPAELLYWAVAALIPVLGLLLAWPPLVFFLRTRREQRLLDSLGERQLRNVLIEDGVEGAAFFERLVLDGGGIHVYLSERREGSIFAGDKLEQWAAVQGNTTRRFVNPLYRLHELLAVVRYHLPKTPADGRVIFLGEVSFPKGRPGEVLPADDLKGRESSGNAELYATAWEQLSERSSPAPAELIAEHNAMPKPCRLRLGAALALMVGELFWLLLAR